MGMEGSVVDDLIVNISDDPEKFKKTDRHVISEFSRIFTGMYGRYTRLRIISALAKEPMNKNQLAKRLDYDFKSIQHSVGVLERGNIVERMGSGYGDVFFLTCYLTENVGSLYHVLKNAEKRLGREKRYIP